MTISDPAYRQAVTAALGSLPRADVATVTTYWSTGSPRLVSADWHATYAVLQLTGADDAARHKTYDAIKNDLTPKGPGSRSAAGVTARVGGNVAMEVAVNNEVSADIAKAEGFSMPLLLLLLLAGRTIAVSGVTVAVALTSLMLFPVGFPRSMGYGGVATVAVDVLAALIVTQIRALVPRPGLRS